MDLKKSVLELAGEYHEDLVGVRWHLHAHPEVSNQESETAANIV